MYVYMYVYVCMYICMYVYMYVCVYVSMCLCIYAVHCRIVGTGSRSPARVSLQSWRRAIYQDGRRLDGL
jgi:hypothetical protein